MTRRRSLVIVRGNFTEGNFGDDALLRAVQELLARHFEPGHVRFEGGMPAYRHGIPGYDGAAAGDDLARAELILYGGGTQFFAFEAAPGHRATLPERITRAMSRPARIAESLRFRRRMKMEADVPVMGVGLGFGPFVAGTGAEEATRALAARMKFLWVRDAAAEEFARGAGCADVAAGADLCFLPEFQQSVLGGRGGACLDDSPRVGIVLRDWPYDKEGRLSAARWIDVARRCRAAGLEAIFFSFSPNRDVSLLRQLAEEGEEVCRWHPDQMTISDYARLLDRCQLLLTSRFHACVFAVLLGKPFLAIAIEPKLRLAADQLLADGNLVEPDAEPDAVVAKILDMMGRLPALCETARRSRVEQSARAKMSRQAFDAAINRLRGTG